MVVWLVGSSEPILSLNKIKFRVSSVHYKHKSGFELMGFFSLRAHKNAQKMGGTIGVGRVDN